MEERIYRATGQILATKKNVKKPTQSFSDRCPKHRLYFKYLLFTTFNFGNFSAFWPEVQGENISSGLIRRYKIDNVCETLQYLP